MNLYSWCIYSRVCILYVLVQVSFQEFLYDFLELELNVLLSIFTNEKQFDFFFFFACLFVCQYQGFISWDRDSSMNLIFDKILVVATFCEI